MRLLIVISATLFIAGCRRGLGADSRPDPRSFAGMRLAHATKLLLPGPTPVGSDPVPAGPESVTYLAEGRPLIGWMVHPKYDDRRPAVLLCHSGFSLAQSDFDLAQPFVAAGFRVFLPTWRGERGNQGIFEMFYGEVNDAVAAANYLANRPDVDPGRIYAAGFGHGATMVALLAEVRSRVRYAAAYEPTLDLAAIIERDRKPPYKETPFDWRNPVETDLRSPARHIRDLETPLMIYVADAGSQYGQAARDFAVKAGKMGKQVSWETPTDSKVGPTESIIEQMIRLFEWH